MDTRSPGLPKALRKSLFRSVASALIFCLLFQEFSYAFLEVKISIAHDLSPMDALCQNPASFKAPLEFCTLKEIHVGTGLKPAPEPPLLIHIQDPHSNYSGQLNLAHTLDDIMKKYGVSLVLVEGGSLQDGSLTSLKKITTPEMTKRAAKSLLMEGNIAGEEYLNLVSDLPMQIRGVEDMALYRKSVKSYAALADKREEALRYLKMIQHAVEKLKGRMYPRELIDYERADGVGGHENGTMDGHGGSSQGIVRRWNNR